MDKCVKVQCECMELRTEHFLHKNSLHSLSVMIKKAVPQLMQAIFMKTMKRQQVIEFAIASLDCPSSVHLR